MALKNRETSPLHKMSNSKSELNEAEKTIQKNEDELEHTIIYSILYKFRITTITKPTNAYYICVPEAILPQK